jgi:hypothetical protein
VLPALTTNQNLGLAGTATAFISSPGSRRLRFLTGTPTFRDCGAHALHPSLAQSGTASYTITITAPSKSNGLVTNTAQVSSSTPDPNTANNTASARVRR